MPKDYARPRVTKSKPKPKKRPNKGSAFHGPSFSGGMLLGAAFVILGAYAPEFTATQIAKLPDVAPDEQDKIVFEFHEMLQNSEVPTDPSAYASATPSDAPPPDEYFIQAASFRDIGDAEQLRASLTLQALEVDMARVNLDNGAWFRVIVGPISSTVEANRVMTRLRDQNLSAILVRPK